MKYYLANVSFGNVCHELSELLRWHACSVFRAVLLSHDLDMNWTDWLLLSDKVKGPASCVCEHGLALGLVDLHYKYRSIFSHRSRFFDKGRVRGDWAIVQQLPLQAAHSLNGLCCSTDGGAVLGKAVKLILQGSLYLIRVLWRYGLFLQMHCLTS